MLSREEKTNQSKTPTGQGALGHLSGLLASTLWSVYAALMLGCLEPARMPNPFFLPL